ncbi:MAG TPA: sugar nucleotide-binding protein, partial [Hyphomicrobiales bacterium]|nr:sugar nucleotide-binding protein [Hyphomicrobiales bacterium]
QLTAPLTASLERRGHSVTALPHAELDIRDLEAVGAAVGGHDAVVNLAAANSVDGFEQKAGFAGRIAVNASLIANPTLLSTYSTSPATVAGDATRSEFIADRLSEGNNVF